LSGELRSAWVYDLKNDAAKWMQYWPNGHLKLESSWNTKPEARDLKRLFFGFVASGLVAQWDEGGHPIAEYRFTNGIYAGEVRPKKMASVSSSATMEANP